MRRGARALLGLARQAAAGGQQCPAATLATAAACTERAAWLRPPSAAAAATPAAANRWPAAAAAAHSLASSPAALSPAGSRGIASSARPQHNAQPAAAEHQRLADSPAWDRTCWQCGTLLGEHDQFFCPDCGSVQPASADPQYFHVFDMDASRFDLDLGQLERRYKGLQRRLHPDKYSAASPLELEYAHQQAAVVNQAYDVLKKPLRRAHYILNQAGFGACEGMTITDPELLMYVMEAREEVEGTDDKPRLQALLDQNAALEAKCLQELSAAFLSGDLQHAAELTTQLRYICRIKEAIVEKL